MKLTMTGLAAILAMVSASGVARAEMIGRYECTTAGAVSQDAVGDQAGHNLASWQYVCSGVDGVLKGASYLGSAITEWSGPKGTWISAGGIMRVPGGLAVSLATDGAGTVIMKDGKPAGVESSGKAAFKFASGALASLSGKTFNWSAKPAPGFGRFTLELTD